MPLHTDMPLRGQGEPSSTAAVKDVHPRHSQLVKPLPFVPLYSDGVWDETIIQ